MAKQVSPVQVGRALESLRNSDFDTYSAVGEVIDNSIQAEAKVIRIKAETEEFKDKRRKAVPIEFAFGDDGHGMERDILHHCLQLGFSTNYNDRKGIGRFGVGMTLAAIAQCRRIEVYSKSKGGDWNFTYLDLDEMKDDPNPAIPEPVRKEVPKKYVDLVREPGTLVIWKKLDRVSVDFDELEYWIARTYRKFIGEEIIQDNKVVPNPKIRSIFLNGKIIHAHDPLYVTKNNNFPDDPKARLDDEIKIPWPIHQVDPPLSKRTGTSMITIRMSLLPEEWRPNKGSGGSKENEARKVPRNEGISILRNDREVAYGEIPHFKITDPSGSGFLDLDRFWGCEISFSADLDHWFSVKNIKVGARPLPELRETLQETIVPTIKSYRNEIRKVWEQYRIKQQTEKEAPLSGHMEAEEILKETLPKPGPVSKEEEKTVIDKILEQSAVALQFQQQVREQLAQMPCKIVEDFQADSRGPFIDVAAQLGKTLVAYNMNHPFFVYTYEIINKIEEIAKRGNPVDAELIDLARKLRTNLDLLISTFATSENTINKDETQRAGDVVEKLLMNWTFNLRKAIEKIKAQSS